MTDVRCGHVISHAADTTDCQLWRDVVLRADGRSKSPPHFRATNYMKYSNFCIIISLFENLAVEP